MSVSKWMSATILPLALGGLLWVVPAQAQKEEKSGKSVYMVYPGQRSFLGVGVVEVTAERAKALKLKDEHGVEITRVEEDSPAAKAGLKVQDIVLEYQGQRVEGAEQFVRFVRETPAGREVKLLVSRGGQVQTIAATIAARKMKTVEVGDVNIAIPRLPDMPEIRIPEISRPVINWRSGILGVEVEALNAQLAEYFGVKEGVLVRSVGKGSTAEKAGVKAGDVIVKVDDRKVSTPAEVTRAVRAMDAKKTFPMQVVREKKETTLNVTLPEETEPARQGRSVRLQQFED